MNTYHIIDEPRSGYAQKMVFNPIWPLFCSMLIGTAYGWLWFITNSFVLNRSLPKRELNYLATGFLVAVLYAIIFHYFENNMRINLTILRYLLLPLTLWKLYISYSLFSIQNSFYEVYVYLHDRGRENHLSGVLSVAMVLYVINKLLLPFVSQSPILTLVVR